jgi:hypothetical protein
MMFTLRQLKSCLTLNQFCLLLIVMAAFGFVAVTRPVSSQKASQVANNNQAKKISFADIAHAYHGLLLDKDLKEIDADPKSLEQLQDSLIESLTSEPYFDEKLVMSAEKVRPKAALDRAYVSKVLNGFKFTDQERALAKSALIQTGINSAPPAERSEYQWRFDLINERVVYQNNRIGERRPEFERYMTAVNLADVSRSLIDWSLESQNYMSLCRENQVPIPPDYPSGEWGRPGLLPFQFNFLASGIDTEILAYQAPDRQGLCYALPRKTGASMRFLGIICQSRSTGKACFWDNIRDWTRCRYVDNPDMVPGCRISGADAHFRIAELQGGSILRENCTECHRGQNAFLIHPETILGRPPAEIRNPAPGIRYSPLGQATWSNPPPFDAPGSTACSGCHEIAEPTPSFCLILQRAAHLTMPSTASPAGWETPTAEFAASIRRLQMRCPMMLEIRR